MLECCAALARPGRNPLLQLRLTAWHSEAGPGGEAMPGLRNLSNQAWRYLTCAAALGLLAGGPALSQNETPAAAPAAPVQNLTIRLTAKLSAAHTPLLMARERGYYAAEGLQVEFSDANPGAAMQVIAGGGERVGYGSAIEVVEAVSAGRPVIMVAVYIPKMPLVLASFPEVPLRTPKDLEGKKLGLRPDELLASILIPFAKINEVALSNVTTVQLPADQLEAQFAAREIDVLPVLTYEALPGLEKRLGVKLNVLKVADFELVLLDQGFFVNQEFTKQQPETVRKLLRASAKGYADTLKDPVAALEIASKYLPEADPEVLGAQLRAALQAGQIPSDKPFGWQNEAQWRGNVDLLKTVGRIKEAKEFNFYFTNDFLE
jgi:NitT/TauT family transport system substrate-binding protein